MNGSVTPDEFYVHKDRLLQGFKPIVRKMLGTKHEKLIYTAMRTERISVAEEDQQKFSLVDKQILEIAHTVMVLEELYAAIYQRSTPIDVEWAYDSDGILYILQVRPETVHSQKTRKTQLVQYRLEPSVTCPILAQGQSVGQKITQGRARILKDLRDAASFRPGDILVTPMTDPDWMPILKQAAGIITDRGGRTCHAAIVSRELGIPALVGAHTATQTISEGQEITLDCSHTSHGYAYHGMVPYHKSVADLDVSWALPTQLMINLADPGQACEFSRLPTAGVGLARLEFIIAHIIKVHPLAIAKPWLVPESVRAEIAVLARGYESPEAFFVDSLAQAVGLIAGAFYPRPVIVRLTDFKSNEYSQLIGGSYFELREENPMLGFRGAARYASSTYSAAFELECRALKKAREEMGFDTIIVMVPFVRTVKEAETVRNVLAKHGLKQGEQNLKLYMMVEVPSNVLLIEQFAEIFDGFSIGSNDLTQLTLGVDRDSGVLASSFNERDPAVTKLLLMAIAGARRAQRPIGICGQAPSDFPELAALLIDAGITSLSLSPDALVPFIQNYQYAGVKLGSTVVDNIG